MSIRKQNTFVNVTSRTKQTNKQAEKKTLKNHQTNKEMKQNKEILEKVRIFFSNY